MTASASMKEMELREHAVCSLCGHRVGETMSPMTFYRITIEHWIVDLPAIQRQMGHTMAMDGDPGMAATVAHTLGPDEDMAHRPAEPVVLTVCFNCAVKSEHPLSIVGLIKEAAEKANRSETIENLVAGPEPSDAYLGDVPTALLQQAANTAYDRGNRLRSEFLMEIIQKRLGAE